MRLEEYTPAIDLRALCWASISALPIFVWQVVDTLVPMAAPYGRFDRYFAFHLFAKAVRDVVLTLGLLGLSLAIGRLFQRKAVELLSFSLTLNALVVAALIVGLELPLALVSMGTNQDDQIAQYALIEIVPHITSQLVAVGVASRLYVAWRASPDVRRSAAVFGVAFALAFISIIQTDWSTYANVSLAIEIVSWANHVTWRLVYAVGDVILFGSVAIGIVRRSGSDGRLGVMLLASIGAALGWWLILYGPNLIVVSLKTGSLPTGELNPFPIYAIARTAAFGAAAGLFYFAVVYREVAGQLVRSLPALIGTARRLRPGDGED